MSRSKVLEGNLINSELNKIVIFDKPINYKEPYFEESIYIAPTEIVFRIFKF